VAVRIRPWSPHRRLVAQSADAARSDRADRGSNPREPTTFPAWRKWLTRSAQTRLNSSASRADSCGFESHRWDHPEGDIVEGKDAALSAREYGFESRCPRQDGLVVGCPSAAEGRDGDLGGPISLAMRVRFPPPRPTAGSFNGRTAVLQTAHGGSIPSPATNPTVSEGKRCAAGL
jgi:hypothetical protein